MVRNIPFCMGGYEGDSIDDDDGVDAMDNKTLEMRGGESRRGKKRKNPDEQSEVEYSSGNCQSDHDLLYTSCSDLSEEEEQLGIDQIRQRKIQRLSMFDDDSPEEEDKDEIGAMMDAPSARVSAGSNSGDYTRFRCFACRFVDKKHAPLNKEKVKKLLRIFEDGYGHSSNQYLARKCHLYFKKEIYLPMRRRGENIEMWRTKEILIHFTSMTHIIDPRIYIGEMIKELHALQVKTRKFSFKRVKHRSGVTEEMQNDKAIKSFLDIHSKVMMLFKAEPEKMNFFDPNTGIDLRNFGKHINPYQNFETEQ